MCPGWEKLAIRNKVRVRQTAAVPVNLQEQGEANILFKYLSCMLLEATSWNCALPLLLAPSATEEASTTSNTMENEPQGKSEGA